MLTIMCRPESFGSRQRPMASAYLVGATILLGLAQWVYT
jgi:hypothetical protein